MPTFSTLCSGGELFGVGARAAGWQHVRGYEIDAKVADVAQLNDFGVRQADICQVDFAQEPQADHLHGSPSCKTASSANQVAGETKEDRAVGTAFERAIRAHTGRTFSLENVWQYRNYDAFKGILAVLKECGFTVDIRHVNAADYGVPQTRKRLILRAVRGGRVPPLEPTHRRGGDLFLPAWIGWYAAVEDILDTLPESEFAPWQRDRLPRHLRETALFHSGASQDRHGNDYEQQYRGADEPAYTVSTMSPGWYKAFLVSGENANGRGKGYRDEGEPAYTLTGSSKGTTRAFIVSAGSNGQHGHVPIRDAESPALTVTPNAEGRVRAFLVGGQYARNNADPDRRVQTADQASPSWTVTPGSRKDTRAWLTDGRVVKFTIQALGRLQSVPDEYKQLTSEINGNGVPPLLAEHIMRSFRALYE